MDELVKVTGVVVKSNAYNDNDRMLTLLTKEKGVVSVSAKGVKSLKNPSAPATNPLCYSSFVLKQKGDIYSLSSADLTESFYSLREDVVALSYGVYFASLAAFVVGRDTPAEEEVRLLLNSLYVLSKYPKRAKIICAAFELKLCEFAGIAPLIGECTCGEEGDFFDLAQGECCCRLHKSINSRAMDKNTKRVMEYIQEADLKTALMFDTDESIATNVTNLVEEFMRVQLGQLPKSLDYVKSLVY